jgi:leucyl aminopeptidase
MGLSSHSSIREVSVKVGTLTRESADLLVLGLPKDSRRLTGDALGLWGESDGPVQSLLATGDFKGDLGETCVVYGAAGSYRRVLLLGLGNPADLTAEKIRSAAASAARRARETEPERVVFSLPLVPAETMPPAAQIELVAEGVALGTYQFSEYKTVDLERFKRIGEIVLLLPDASLGGLKEEGMAAALNRGRVRAEGTNFARDLANTPANFLTPSRLAEWAEVVAQEEKLTATVMDRSACEKAGMGAFLSVARGSAEPPWFVVLEYDCGRRAAPLIGLVGKGLTFDAGGISLKPGLNMHEMKYDMCGAAAVLGAMKCVRRLGLPVNVVAAIPATENLPGGRATKPGDVVRSVSGKTIEVLNTDAEGRLILADALAWLLRERKPAVVVDLATLTGAVLIALGHYGAAVLSNDDDLAGRIESASASSGERTWRLPLWEEYPDHLKGETADLKNIADSSAGAGTIAGGAFLREFVGETPWAHIDIAGTAWWDKDRPHLPKGPSGFGVRLLLDLLEGYGK